MSILKALCLAFSTYSRIPMPNVKPDNVSMRYLLCFLPLVGAVIGGLFMLWFWVCARLEIGSVCFAAAVSVIPVLVTGGIHADGLIDTADALSSYGGKEKMLEILSDPHVGAFGIITAIAYYLLYFGFLTEIQTVAGAAVVGVGFVISRALCALTITLIRNAKNSGMLYALSASANRAAVIVTAALLLAAGAFAMICISPFAGCAVVLVQILLTLYYMHFTSRKLGGITGDTCGWFIQMSELLTVIAVVMGGNFI